MPANATSTLRSMLSRARQLGRNASITAGTIRDHLFDDPVVLSLQVSRRLPNRLTGPIATVGARVFSKPISLLGVICAEAAGQEEDSRARLRAAALKPLNPLRAALLADAATALGETDTAAQLLDRPDQAPRGGAAALLHAAAGARLYTAVGELTAAVEHLRSTAKPGSRVLTRLEGKRAVLLGTKPSLPQVSKEPLAARSQRVLHLLTNSLPHTGSGYAQRSHSILAAQRDLGWEPMAVTRAGWPVLVGKPLAKERDVVDGITYRRILPARLGHGEQEVLQCQADALNSIVGEYRPSVLHTTTHFVNAQVTGAVAQSRGLPWVYEVRGQLADTWASTRDPSAASSEYYRLFTEREAEAARSADAVVTLGEEMKQRLITQGVAEEKITVCPNAVGEDFLAEPGSKAAARAALGLEPEGEYIGTVSSIVAYEGLDDLLEAFALLAEVRPRLQLAVVGDGVSLPGLKHRAAELGVADRCRFPGRVPRQQARTWHEALDIFVVPRKDLPVTRSVTPLKPVEASATARPVVASSLPALKELVHHGRTGLLTPPEDAEALAQALEEILADPSQAAQMGRAGREWALAERTWKANAEKYDALYRHVMKGGIPVA